MSAGVWMRASAWSAAGQAGARGAAGPDALPGGRGRRRRGVGGAGQCARQPHLLGSKRKKTLCLREQTYEDGRRKPRFTD